jgi:circadian clock protein KaiC
LALYLTSWEATGFSIGKFVEAEICENPAFTVADGLIGLSQVPKRNSVVRKLLIVKSRGQASVPGLHTFRITDDGLHTYSRTYSRTLGLLDRRPPSRAALGFPPGNAEIDKMMGGGIVLGDPLLVAGAAGTGKSAFGTHCISEGPRHGAWKHGGVRGTP